MRGGVLSLGLLLAACSGNDRECAPGDLSCEQDPLAFECAPETTGLVVPLPTCSEERPCVRTNGQPMITTPDPQPACGRSDAYPDGEVKPAYDDGTPGSLAGIDGSLRSFCAFSPDGATPDAPRPLLIWFHGGAATSTSVYDNTLIRDKALTFDLTGDINRPGFILAVPQSRALHWPSEDERDNTHWDYYYRDLESPSTNPDIAFIDGLIDDLAAGGSVDTNRIYVMGWSTGGFFAQLYAIARHDTPTPGGHRVAAAAIFSAADPFHDTDSTDDKNCRQTNYPNSSVPLFLLSRTCDLIPCNELQAERRRTEFMDGTSPLTASPGHVVSTWVADLAERVQDENVSWQRITAVGEDSAICAAAPSCGLLVATSNHVRWPDGLRDAPALLEGDEPDQEPRMLDFLRVNPL